VAFICVEILAPAIKIPSESMPNGLMAGNGDSLTGDMDAVLKEGRKSTLIEGIWADAAVAKTAGSGRTNAVSIVLTPAKRANARLAGFFINMLLTTSSDIPRK
jgi:NAD(P)H-hydrate repair Nnr-like enzyme with NAD(P)H-hydrate dehydratase domain